MYFNRKNATQKNWRMIKKGKHFLFGCSLVFAVGATLVTPTVKADTVAGKGEVETTTTNSDSKASPDEEVGNYKAPATVATQPVAVEEAVVAEKPTVKVVNKEALTQLVEEVKGLDKTGKTEDSLSRLNTALEQAQKVLTNAEASQDQVDAAVASLKEAVAQLAAKEEKVATVVTEEKAEVAEEKTEASEEKAEETDQNTETSATQPKSRSRRAAGQERAQDRSMEGRDIKYVWQNRQATLNGGDPTQRAKIEYRQLDDYEVVNGKTVPTDPSGQGRPVLEWTVTFNEAQYDKPGGYWYFTIPKNVSDPYNFVTDYDGVYINRYGWKDANKESGAGIARAEGVQYIDDGNKLEMRVKNSTGSKDYNKVDGLSGVMGNSKKVYVLQTSIYSGVRKFTVRYRTVVEDPSQTISYLAGVESSGNLPRFNWNAISGKYDKHLVSQVATPSVTPNLTNTSVNVPVQTVASTSSTLSGTGTPGATIKLYIDGREQNIGNVTVDNDGNWTTGELPTALNNNQGDGTTIKPRQIVQVSQTVNGTESSRRTVPVSVGMTTVEPSSLSTNQDAVIAGQKEVALKVPHDAGIAYLRYTNTAGQTVEIPVKRDNASAAWVSQKSDKATVKSYAHGKFEDTIVLTMADKIAGTEVSSISNVVEGGFSSVAGWEPRSVENQAPTIASAVEGNEKTVAQGAQLDLASLVTVADKEDDAQATLGDKVHAEVVSVNGNTATKTVDTNTQGTYTVKYKAVDSQGKESGEIEVTVVVNPARQNEAPTVEIPYSNKADKEVYVYGGEENSFDIKFKDDSGKIASATVKQGGNKDFGSVAGEADTINTQYGFKANVISSETPATADAPAVITYRGTPAATDGLTQDRLTAATKGENPDGLVLGWRYATATDTDGALIENKATGGSTATDPGAFRVVLKPQNQKYDIATPTEKVTVADPANVTEAELAKIKEKVQLEYSKNNDDANLADKKGTTADKTNKIQSVTKDADGNLVVTYADGSIDKKPLSEFVNVAPTVEIPYSNKDTKEVYVYGGEESSFDIKFKDDSGKIASATVKQGGNKDFGSVAGEADTINTQYGFKANVINAETPATADAPAVITYRGTPAATDGLTQDRLTAATKGENPAGLPLGWRYATATDTDGALIENTATGGTTATDPGAFRVVLKPQNQKYDIATPTEKVTVADPANVTEAELAKIKEKVQLEYSKNNDDANLADKKGTTADKTNKIQSVTKDDNGNLVVTYTDGSIDKKPLSEFVNVAPTVEIPYSNKDTKEVYVYGGEENSFDIKFKDDSGKIASATVKQGGNKDFGSVAGEADTINTQYGFKANVISSETPATADAPAVITYRGTPAATDGLTQDRLTAATKGENPAGLPLGWRYATATDTDGALIENKATGGSTTTDPGAFRVVLKPQNQKYDIATPTEKVTVADPANVTEAELAKIKEKVQLEYSKNNDDANLAGKKGTPADKTNKIQSVTKDDNGNLVVTYTDGSIDKKPLSEFVNVAPTVELPYSNEANKQIYVYTGENTDLTFKGTDEKEVKDLYLRGPGDVSWNNANKYGFTTGKVENGAVTGEGSVSEDKTSATIKMTGTTNLKAGQEWTSFIVSKDNNGELSNTDYRALDVDPNAKEKPGYVRFVVKNQTSKYDIATPAPADKVEVADPTKVTDAELDKIKEKLQIEYAQTNDDANFADKKGKTVDAEDAKTKIKSVEKDNAGNLVVTYTDGSTDKKPLSDFVVKDTTAPAKPSTPVVDTDLTGKAGTKTPVEVTAEPGTKVELFDKDGNKIGEGVADENGKAKITPTVDIPEGNVTAKATKDGQTSDASAPKEATAATPAKPSTPVVDTDLTGKAGTKTPVEVTAEPGTKVELFDKDGNKIGEGVADENGKAKITPTVDIPEGNVTAKATKDGQTSDASAPKEATAATPAKPSTPVVDTDLTGKAGTKTPVEVTAEPGTKVELFDKDGNKIGEGVADENGKAKITPTVDIPEGNVTAKATKDGQTSDASAPKEATAATPAKPSTPVVDTDLTGKAGTKTPVEVTAEPGTKVELFDKDGNKIGEGVADENGKAKITPTVDIPEGNVTAKATKDGQTSDASAPKEATAATPAKPSTPVVDTDLTGKAGTKTPVEVTAEPGTKVELFDKDGNKIGEGVADENGKAKITPTVDIPEGNVTAKATKDGQTSDASAPKEATAATPAKPSTPVVDTDLTGKAGTKTPVEVTAEPGTKVELFDKDGNKIGEGVADENGKAKITPTVDIPEGNVTAKATKDGQTSDASAPKEATAATPAKPSTPVVDTDLTGKAGTKTPVEVTAEPGTKVELFDKDGNKIGEGVADENGKAKITPTVDIPEGNVTAKATKDGQTSDASAPKEATAATPAKPSTPVVDTDLTGKAGTKTPVEVTAEPGTKVELFDKDGNKIGEGVADENGKAKITPTVDIPEGNVTAKATKDGQTSDASAPKEATAATPAKPSTPVVDTDLTGKAGTKTPVEVTAEPGTKVELFDKDGNKIGEGVADENGKAKITPTVDIPEGNVTAKATKDGQTSDASAPKEATAATPAKPSTPVVDTDLTGKAGTKTPVEVTAEPGTKVELFDKDGNKIGEGVADENGKAKITPTVDIPEGNVTAKATKDGQTSDASAPKEATAATPAKPSTPVVDTDLTGKAGTKTPVEVTAEPGTKVELFDKDGNKIGEGVADENGKAKITPTVDIPEGNVTAKATKDGQTSDASAPKEATAATPAKPSTPVVDTDLTGKAGTKTPVEVTAEPGTKVELFDKDGNKIGEGVADENGKAKITPTVDIPEGNVTAKATKDGQTSDASAPKEATAATPAKPSTPVVDTDLTGKAGTKTPVEVTAEPGTKVELFDKDGNKIGEGVADENGKAKITPTVDIPEGNVTAKATKDGQTSDASAPKEATAATPAKPSTPVVDTDLTGKAGTKTPVEVTAEPGTKVELFDKDGNKIGEGVADENGKAKITPTVDIPEGNVTAKATKDGQTSDASAPKEATAATPAKPSTPVVDTDLTGKAGTKTPVEVTAEPGTKVELFDKDGNKIGEGVADENGKAKITPTVDIPEGNVTAKATKDGQTSDASAPKEATAATPAKPSTPVVDTDLTGKAGTKTPVEVTAEPGTKVELFDKDGNKIGEGVADENGKAKITPTVDIPEGNVTAKATKDGQTSDASAPKEATAATPAKPSTPVVDTDLTGKAGTKTPVEVTAEPGTKVELFDKDGNKIGEGVADENGKAKITPTVDIPEGNVTAKATKDGQTSDASAPKEATAATPAKPSTPVVDTDLTGKAGTKTPVEVTAEPGTKVELFDKDGNKIGEGVADENGKAKITPTVDIPEGNVTAKATKDGQTSDASAPKEATAATPAKPSTPVVDTDLTGKAGTKTPVEVTAEPGTKVELFDKDGNKIGEGVADENGKAKITPTVDIPEGNVTAKATKDGQTSDASAPKEATAATPAKPSTPVVDTDLTGKAGTKTPVEVTAEPGTKVELFDKDGNKIGEGVADENGKAKITPTVDIPEGNVTAKATKDGQTSDASAPKEATAATPAKPSTPVVDTDLTGKAGTKTPVEVTAEPGTKVELFDKDGNKIGEGVADENGKAKITPTVDIPEGNVTAKATKDGQTSDASAPKEATAATPAKPSTPVVDTDLTGKAGTKTPVEVTAEPGTKVELFDKDGNKIGEGVADENGKAKITPTVDIPEGNVTAKATKDGQTSDASAPKEATAATPAKPSTPVVDTDLTGKAGTKTPVEVTAEPGTKVELFDKDGNKIGEGVADENGKAKITPTVDIPEGNVTAKATKDGQTSDASAPKEATAATPAKPSTPVVDTDLTGKAGTKTPVEVTAEPGTKVELFDKDGNKIGEGVADENGKAKITPTVDIPEGNVTAKATKDGQTSDASAPKEATAATPAKPSTPVVDTDLTGKAGTKTPVEVTAEPGTKVELFDKDGNKIGEGVADENGKAKITPTVDIPEGNVTAKATKDGQTSDASAPKEATAATPAKPSTPVVDTDLTGKAGTKTPVEVTAEPGTKVELFDKDGNKIGEGVADENGKAKITPTVDIPEGNVTAKATKDGQTSDASAPKEATAATPAKPSTPVVDTDLTGKAGTKTPVEVTAEPGTKVELFDKDGNKIGEGVADENGKAKITPTVDIPEGNVTAKATKDGQTSDASAPKEATAATPAKPSTPVVDTDLTGKAGTKTPVEVTAEPGTKVELFDKDGNKIGEGVADENGKAKITPTVDIPEGNVTAKATKDGQTSDASAPKEATAATPAKPSTPVVDTDLTGKAGTKTPVEVTAEPGTKVELFDKDGNKIGEGVADENGKAKITPTVDIPEGNVTAKATKDGQTSDASAPKEATAATPAKPSTPVVDTDLTGKAGTKTPVEVTAEPGTKVELFDKDGNKIGEGVADENGKAKITPTVDIPEGNVTAKATKDGQTSDASAPKEATAATPAKPSTPVVDTDLTGKAGTKTPVEVTAEPGTKVELFDKDGNKIGEGVADENGKAKITPTVDIPEGNVTAKATKDGQTSDASAPKEATAATPAKPSTPVVDTDLTGKAGTKTPVEVTAEPGTKVELFDKDGNKIGEGVADENGKAKITPTVDIPEGNVTAKATKDGQTSDASAPKEATAATPAKPSTPVVDTDLTGKAGTKTPVEVTAEPGTKVELFDKDGNKIGEGVADENGKAKITPTVDIPEGNVTAKATKDGQTSDASAPKEATAATPAKPSTPVVDTDLTGKAGTKTPVEVTAEPGTKVELFDKDGNKIGEGVADENGKAKITPTVDIPEGNVTAKATKDGQTSDASAPKEATAATPAKPSTPVVDTDLTGKAGTKTPVEVTAEPGTKVELFDKDGNKIGEGVADENGKAKITPTVDIPEGNVTAKATKDGQTSDASAPKEATAATPAKPSTPVVDTDLTGKAGTKTPVEVTAEPGTKVELFDKDGNKIGEGVADENGKAKITPTVDIPEGNVTAKATKDGQTSDASAPKEATAATPAKPSTPVVDTDLTGKAGTKTPVEVTAEPGTKVELFDKDGNKIGEGVADENGKAKITPTVDIPEGNVTAKATKDGQTSDASAPKEATAATPAKPSTPVVDTDLTGKAGTKTPVEVTAEPGTKVELFDKDGNKIGEGVADENGKAKITPTVDIPEGNVTAKATKDGQTSDASAPKEATAATPAKPSTPVVDTDLTGKAGTKTPVEVTAEPGTKVELFDKDGNKIGEGVADENGKAKITPTVDIPEGNVTAKATKDGQTSDASAPKEATAATPAKPSTPVVDTDLTGKAGTKTPVEVTAEPGTKVELFDKDGNKIGEGVADENGKAKITPTVDIPEGNVTAKATKDGQTSDASAPKEATAATPAKPSTPVVDTDLTGKAGTKTPVEVTAEPGTKVELFDKDGNKIGEGVADENGKAKITPTVDIPEGNVTAKATKDGQTSDASAPKEATAATPAKPSTPVVDTDLTGKAGTKTPVEVTAEPGTKVELFDKDGNKIGEGVADENGKAKITPTVDIPEGNVTAKATKDGQTSDASAPKEATAATPAKPSTPVVDTDLTGKAGTKTPVEVTAEPGTKVELFDKDGNKIGEGVADENGKAKITPTVDIPEGNVTAKATKDGQTSDASDPVQATAVDKVVKTPSVTPVANPSSLTDAEKAKVADEVKKSNPTVSKVEVGNDGTTTVTYPDGTTAVIPADKTVKKSDDKAVKDPTVTPVTDPSNLTDAEKAKVADEVKKANPTVTDVKVGEDGTTTVTYPGGTTAVIPSNKTVKRSVDKELKDPAVTPVTNPSNLTDAEKAKVANEVKKANPTVTDVKVDKDGATTVTYPDGTTAVIPADKTVKKSDDKVVTDPSVTPVTDPSNLTDDEKAKVVDEVKKANPTVTDVKVGNDGTTTVTYPDGTTAVIPADKTVKKSDDKVVKDPSVTPVTDPSNLTDAEKAKVADEVKKANPTVTDVKVDKDGTTTVTYPDGTTAVIPADKTVKKSDDKGAKDPSVTPVTDPSNLTNAEKAKVADEVKKANPTVTDVKVDKDGTTTVTYPDGTTAVIPADKTVKKSDDKVVTDPSVTPVTDPSNLTDDEKAKVVDEVKKANPTVTDVKVGNDGTTTVTYPDGTTAVIPADKTVKKSDDKVVKDPSVTPVADPSNLTDAEKAKVADEVKKANPTVTDVKVGNDGTTTVTYPDGTTAVIPADKTVKKSEDKAVKDPSVTPVADPSNLTDAEKAKVADEVKKSNPTVSKVEVGNDGTTTVTYPDGTTAVVPADKTVKKSEDKAVKDPSVTPVTDPSNLTDAEKAKVVDEVKKANPTVSKVEVGNDGTTTVTYPDGTTAVIPADKTVKKSDDKTVKDPSVTPVTDPSNLTDTEKAKVAEEVKKANPTAKDIVVNNDGSVVVTFEDGTTAIIPADKTVKKSSDKAKESDGVKNPSVTPVTDPSNLTDTEKAKVADEVKKANPTAKDIVVNKDGSVVVTFEDGSTAIIPADKTVKKSSDKAKESDGVKNPSVTPVTDPSNLTDAEKAKVAEEVKKANPTAKDIKVNKDGSVVVTFEDGSTAIIPADKTVKKSSDKAKESDGVKNPSVTPVTDPSNLTDAEKAKVAEEVKKANPTAKDIVVNNDGSVVVTFADGSVAVIPAEKAVTAANQESPAQGSAKKAGAKELPNTGTKQSSASLGLALLAAVTGGLLIAKKREEEE